MESTYAISSSTAGWRTPIASQYWENGPPPMNCNARVERSLRSTMGKTVPDNGRFLRHCFSPKPKVIATQNSLPKRIHVAKEAVSAAWQTRTRQRSERICKPNDAPKTKQRPCVKTMLGDPSGAVRSGCNSMSHPAIPNERECQSGQHRRAS